MSMPTPDEFLSVLVPTLWRDRQVAKIVPRQQAALAVGQLLMNNCHMNAAGWVRAHPSHKAVRGWLIFDLELGGQILGYEPHFDFLAHTVIEDEKGALFDITPVYDPLAGTYPFLPHPGPQAEFDEMVDTYNLVRIKLYTQRSPMRAAWFAR
jgi:hypothetical protein